MPSLTIKGIPEQLLRRLRRRALLHRRSLNGEVVVCLEQAVQAPVIDPETWLADVDRLLVPYSLQPSRPVLRQGRTRWYMCSPDFHADPHASR